MDLEEDNMTAKELNRDIKRLWNKRDAFPDGSTDEYWNYIKGEFKKEFKRLYYADTTAKNINLRSFRIMHRLNQSHRVIPFAYFYINMEIK